MNIRCAGEELILWPDRAVSWPRKRTLLVADPHFGKPATFRNAGIPVPENTTAADLARLDALLEMTSSTTLVILGDFLHAKAGRAEPTMNALGSWCEAHRHFKIILIMGNHDLKAGQPPLCWNFEIVREACRAGPFWFTHIPCVIPGHYVIGGHFHPAIALRERYGAGLRAPCFCFGTQRAILPAFGSFTGTSPVQLEVGDRLFAVGEGEVMEVQTKNPLKRFRLLPIAGKLGKNSSTL